MELDKGKTPDARAIRASAYYRLHELVHAKSELEMARKADKLPKEAEAMVAQ